MKIWVSYEKLRGSPVTEDSKTFETYTNSGDTTVQVKVEQPISDGITN